MATRNPYAYEQPMLLLKTFRGLFKVLVCLELAIGSLLSIACVYGLCIDHSGPHLAPNDNLGPALLFGIVMPIALFLLMGGIAAIRKWRHQLPWQVLPISVLAFIAFVAGASLLRIQP